MAYRTAADILEVAAQRGMRRAFFVTALMLEMQAVRAHLTDMGSVLGRDGTIYECGSFSDLGQEWLVVVAETGAGTHPAQNVVSQAHNLFDSFEVMILVGVGGSRKEDAPLGSVVASDKVYMPYSGKAGKTGFTNRPVSYPVGRRLIGIAKKVRLDGAWPNRIRPPAGGTLPALEVYPVAYPPGGIVAPIASIEAVLDNPDSELEALLAQGYSDTCVVEMEGYGAVYAASAEQTPGIVVRGVSDMTEDKSAEKDATLQPIAACHAAAFGFEMLSHWGQLYEPPASAPRDMRRRPEPAPPAEDLGTSGPDDAAPEGAVAASLQPRISVVMNVLGDIAPQDQDRIERFQTSLRAIAADEEIEIVDAQAGSLHLFIADPNASLVRIDRDELHKAIAERENVELAGMVPLEAYSKLREIRSAFASASTDLLAWPATLPDGERLDRPELEELRARIENHTTSTTALLGAPGAGKSALLATLGRAYSEADWPVLAIKADLLDADIDSEAALKDRLGLDDLPSNLIRQLADFGPVLLLIDQLDALAGYLDLRTGRLSILLNLIRKLGGRDNVHIVLSSRTFEFNHDVRLRSVSAESIMLDLPAWSEILAVLEARGVNAAGWPADAQEVMRTPQALATYLQLGGRYSSEPFTSYQAMLDRLWSERVLVGDNGAARDQLATDIADAMANEESLWLANARFSDRTTELLALVGAGVLAPLESSVGFSHQTLFEFALARGFAREPGRLSRFVLERQGSLFLRPKLWAGLNYLRATDINAYHRELEIIWRADNLRPHLRVLLVDFLGSQSDPTDREALLMETALTKGNARLRAFRALGGSQGWFKRFSRSFIAEAMTASDDLANAQIDVLQRALPSARDEVVRLLGERWLPDPAHDLRAWWVVQSTSDWTQEILDVALTIVRRSKIATNMVNHLAGTLGVDKPDLALKLILERLTTDLAAAVEEAQARAVKPRPAFASLDEEMAWNLRDDPREPVKRLIEHGDEWDSLAPLAEQSPQNFLAIIWPWFLDAFEALGRFARDREPYVGYPLPYEADYRFEGESDLELPEPALLGALRIAVERTAELDEKAFPDWVKANEPAAFTPVQRLIAHGIGHQPERFADLGLEFLLGDERRFYLGSIHDFHGTTKALVAKVSPFWSQDQLARYEQAVRGHRPPAPSDFTDPKRRMEWRHMTRRTQLDLLRALPTHQRSAAAERQVVEEERRFGSRRSGATFTGARWIGPVLEAAAMPKAGDDDIVNAFTELPDATGWDHPRNWMTGGNIQLARAFATFAKDHPERAVRIIGRLDSGTGTRATGYVIDALAEEGDPATVFALLRDVVARGFDGEEFRQSAARALERISNRETPIDDEFVDLLESWLRTPIEADASTDDEAGDGADEEVGEDAESVEADENDANQRSLLWGYGGFGIVPGGEYPIAEALVHIRLLRKEPDQAVAFLDSFLDRERSLKLWDGLARFLPYLWPADAGVRNAFLDRLFAEVPGLIGSRPVAQFLANAHHHDADFADRHVEAWKKARSRAARQAYGEIVAVVGLVRPQLEWGQRRLEEAVADDSLTDARAGAASTAANLFREEPYHAESAHLLARLLARGGKGVWEAAFDLFRMVDELQPDDATIEFLSAIADKMEDAPQINATFVVDRLATLLPHQAELVGRLALGLTEKWRSELGDIRTATAMAASQLVDLAITLHRLGPQSREVGTALFEQLIETDAYEARQMLDEIDNRFRDRAPVAPRRRLRRRSEHPARGRAGGG